MTDIDELDINPFFRLLQTTYHKIYEKAQDNSYVVCVPQTSSLSATEISQNFVESHILKPSPYFKSEFVTLDSDKKIVHLHENGKEFETKEGFPEEKSVPILSEELGYNKMYKPYKILILSEPFHTKAVHKDLKEKDQDYVTITFSECKRFLHSYAEYRQIIRTLEESLQVFMANYMVLRDFLDDVKDKLQQISVEATEGCCKCTKMSLWSDPRFKDALSSSVESVVMGTVHKKVFPVVCEKFTRDDKELFRKCQQLHGVLPDTLGVDPKISCSLPSAVTELASLDKYVTPMEKLHCLKKTVDYATKEIEAHVEANRPPPISPHIEESAPCLTSDDLIPILVTVVAEARCLHLASNIFYMEYFHWSTDTKDRDSLSYFLVSFKAAVEYMKNTDFSHIKDKSRADKKNSITHMTNKSSSSMTTRNNHGQNGRGAQTVNRNSKMDGRINHIVEILKDTSLTVEKSKTYEAPAPQSVFGEDYKMYQKSPDSMPARDTKPKKEKFGDFLSSLDDDMFDSPFGKQT